MMVAGNLTADDNTLLSAVYFEVPQRHVYTRS